MKKDYLIVYFILFTITWHQALQPLASAVTCELSGRLGDILLKIWQAKYFARKKNLPFLCPKFSYINEFVLSNSEKIYTSKMNKRFKNIIRLKNDFTVNINKKANTLYIAKTHFTSKHGKGFSNPDMVRLMRALIKPAKPIKSIKLKKNCVNVALHVRRGSGSDESFLENQKKWPTKFPPDSYYINALRKLSMLYNHQPIHVHLFTDIANPGKIVKQFGKMLSLKNITFSYRQHNKNAHKDNVIEDLFSMVKCDALIRGTSGFAKVAHYIGNHTIVMAPKHPVWENNTLYIKELKIFNRL